MSVTIRAPRRDDTQAVYQLLVACDLAEWGAPDVELAELSEAWDAMDLARDAWLAEEPDGRIVAYAEVHPRRADRLDTEVYVHPDRRRLGIGSRLLPLAEARGAELAAAVPAGPEVAQVGYVNAANPGHAAFATTHGYAPVRRFWRMQIDQVEAPPAPGWPAGIELRTFRLAEDERATYATVTEAFEDHWGSAPMPFEQWLENTRGPNFDPQLWFLALEGDEVAGVALCFPFLEMGWIGQLAVRRPWRRRGLGRALLLHAFGAFWQRGRRRVALGVDSENLTGATRLYESVGMRVERAHDRYQRIVRAGTPLGRR
jgi:mycothiol synthase